MKTKAVELAHKHWLAQKNPMHCMCVVDFTLDATQDRLHLVLMQPDLSKVTTLLSFTCAHGSGSGLGDDATKFSDVSNSHCSVLGLMKTGATVYYGKHGKSLRLYGLEPKWNGNILSRAIVIHSAPYVTDKHAGHSWGCFAVAPAHIDLITKSLVGGALLFSYASQYTG